MVFVQCAGQRDDCGKHLPYCSGHCCATSIKQAMYFKDADPEVDTVVLYTDLRMPGMGEDFYRSAQHKGVTFTKGKASAVEAAGNGCSVRFRDLILDEDATVSADLVVLATGQVSNAGVDLDTWAKVTTQAEGGSAEAKVQQIELRKTSVLNLNYRQGPDLPQLKHGFADSHFICFPYETRRTGIYAAGPVRRPMDMAQAREDATGAALKAIQALENAALGRAAHPRSGDLSYPIVRLEGCTQCKRCTVECPFGAIDEDERRFPVFNESRCRRCGTCMGACPVRVISFENYSVDSVGAQIKAVDMPDEFSEKPRILVLACENDAYPALDMAGMQRHVYSAFVRVDPGALPGLGEHDLDHRRAQRRLRRRDDARLQEGRRLPVPLRQGLGAGQHAHEQDRRHAQAAQPRVRARHHARGGDHRHRARAAIDRRRTWPGSRKSA